MTLDSIFPNLRRDSEIILLPDAHESLTTVNERPFYIEPIYSDIATSRDCNFRIFSAPGATGKSALAKYLAYISGGLYWDLSKIKLGENSFHGTLFRALGAVAFSEFTTNFTNGSAYLIIDAFDEADMISGREALEHFLSDLNSFVTDRAHANAILLARTETALFVNDYLKSINGNVTRYEIGFFEEHKAKEFIQLKAASDGVKVSKPINDYIDQQFTDIKRAIEEQFAIKSFIGYAPVLEALVKTLKEQPNTAKLLSSIKERPTGSDIIIRILDDLLYREQEKVHEAMKTRFGQKLHDFDDWESIYSIDEQIARLANYITFGKIDPSDYETPILDDLLDEYGEMLIPFLTEHPFIQKTAIRNGQQQIDFTGPAFRDYVLAKLMIHSDYEMFADEYFNNQKSSSFFPSQLFFDYYYTFNDSKLFSHHFPYVYESFKSKETSRDSSVIQVSTIDDGTIAVFSSERNQDCNFPDVYFDVIMTEHGLCINQLTNASIDIDGKVVIGTQGENARIYNSSIICTKIVWDTMNLRIEAYSNGQCLIASKEAPESKKAEVPFFDVHTDNPQIIKVSIPDFKLYYKLRKHAYSLENEEDLDITKFAHALRKILICFRKHKKDTPAKHKERIDNVILAHSPLKQSIFTFLASSKAIYEDSEPLYKVDLTRLGELGINWDSLSKGDEVALKDAFGRYLIWKNG